MNMMNQKKNGKDNPSQRDSPAQIQNHFSCSVCDKSYDNKRNLLRHEETHAGVSYPCKFCNGKFTQEGSANRHENSCNKKLINESTFCNKIITRSRNVKVQERIQKGESPYAFSICEKKFIDSRSTKRHEKICEMKLKNKSISTDFKTNKNDSLVQKLSNQKNKPDPKSKRKHFNEHGKYFNTKG